MLPTQGLATRHDARRRALSGFRRQPAREQTTSTLKLEAWTCHCAGPVRGGRRQRGEVYTEPERQDPKIRAEKHAEPDKRNPGTERQRHSQEDGCRAAGTETEASDGEAPASSALGLNARVGENL